MANKKKKPVTSMKICILNVEINGTKCQGVNYERVEYSDGSVVERGLPEGMKPEPGLDELIQSAFKN